MQKIRCPRCAVINLEKFVTFPHCAGCGGLLPGVRSLPTAPLAPLWRRPLAAVLWASIVGCIVIGLIVTAAIFEEQPKQSGQVAVYGQLRYSVPAGNVLRLRPTIKAEVNGSALQGNRPLRDVRIRLPRKFFQDFRLIRLEPQPDDVFLWGSGHYFHYDVLPLETQLQVTVRALRAGEYPVAATISAQGQTPDDYNVRITVMPNPELTEKGRARAAPSVRTVAPQISRKR